MTRDSAAADLLRGLPPDAACLALLDTNGDVLEDFCAQLLAMAASSGADFASSFQVPALEQDLVSLGLGRAFARDNTVTVKIAEGGGWRKSMSFYKEETAQSGEADDRPTEVQLAEALDAHMASLLAFPGETAWSVISATIRRRILSGPPDPASIRWSRTIVVPNWVKSRFVDSHWRVSSGWDAATWRISQRSRLVRELCRLIDPHGIDLYAPSAR